MRYERYRQDVEFIVLRPPGAAPSRSDAATGQVAPPLRLATGSHAALAAENTMLLGQSKKIASKTGVVCRVL